MKFSVTAAVLTFAVALAAAPAVALPPQASEKATPGPNASAESKRKAYGKFCQDQSKKRVKGQKGTPFSQCVTAMAKAAKSESTSPREACKGMSKKHVNGEKGTPFSRCVVAAAKLKREQEEESGS
jgi:FlaG/FlaF family flagellin (archaellin)